MKAESQVESEIQVYASPTVGNKQTIFELHSNYTIKGIKDLPDPSAANYLNESLEITHGFGNNFEIGCYFFTTFNPSGKYEYLGSHIRPRFTAPASWNWKLGVSLSAEFGFFRQGVDQPFYWEGEIRPIIDKTTGNWYFSLNPNIDFILTGDNKHWGLGPQFKTVYTIRKKFGLGLEYYGELGTFSKIYPIKEEEHLLGPMLDLYLHPKWELNTGFLFGLTPNSNQRAVKLIIGRRI
ncbi:MAG: transporter [Flavisolibacter sp.]